MDKISLLLADDHSLVRHGMRELLSNEKVIGDIIEAKNGHEAVMMFRSHLPDVVVMDYEMPNFDGIYATRQIKEEQPETPVLLVSAHSSLVHIMEGIQAGVSGFIPKAAPAEELVSAIIELASGGTWFKGEVAELIAPGLINDSVNGNIRGKTRNKGLSQREKEVLKLFAVGKNAEEIANELSISKRTVDVHKSNIFQKIKVKNIAGLVCYAIKNNMVKF